MTRGLREHMLDFHKTLCGPRKTNIENIKTMVLSRVENMSLATKNVPEASEVLHLPHGIIIMSKIENDDSFTRRDFRPFQNVVQVHPILRLPCKMTSKNISHFDRRLPTSEQRQESAAPATRMKTCSTSCHAQRRFIPQRAKIATLATKTSTAR